MYYYVYIKEKKKNIKLGGIYNINGRPNGYRQTEGLIGDEPLLERKRESTGDEIK